MGVPKPYLIPPHGDARGGEKGARTTFRSRKRESFKGWGWIARNPNVRNIYETLRELLTMLFPVKSTASENQSLCRSRPAAEQIC